MQMLCSVVATVAAVAAAGYRDEALLLFRDAEARMEAGKYGTAALAFQAVASVYPESPLAEQARRQMAVAEQLERRQEGTALVRSIRFRGLKHASADEVMRRFEEREVGLAVEENCHPREIARAREVLAELLAEKGVENPRVHAAVRRAAGKIDVTFRLAE
jgi:hypothetical protein